MKNILFVDDEPMFLDSIKRRLRNERGDWKLFFAGTVDEALALIRNHPFDTIVSDVKMPGKDGFALLGALQSRKETRNIPLVMLTGTQDHELKLKALRMGASDLLNKPVNRIDLITRLNSCLRLKGYHDEIIRQNLLLEEKAQYLALNDTLTNLPNRNFFHAFLGKTLQYAERCGKPFSVLLLDLDDFNRINESLGHGHGDRCLQILSGRLSGALRSGDCVGRMVVEEVPVSRMGGDEFIVLLRDNRDIHAVGQIARRILAEISVPIELAGHDVFMTASMGIAAYPDDGKTVDDLLKNTETALNHAKKEGKNSVRFYSKAMNETSIKLLDLESRLRKALEKREFILHYQPKVCLTTNRIMGTEALMRWETEPGARVPPSTFIPLAESNGLIIPMGNLALEDACAQNRKWQMKGMRKIRVAVNVSALQFRQHDFVEKVLSILERSGLSPEYLELEITETLIMKDPEGAIRNLTILKDHGIHISMDDFGTGYSSLNYLQKLPIDTLKIDMSFIKNMVHNPNDAVIVKTIIVMAHSLGLEVVAEGVEDARQLALLKDLDCDTVQGYLFSPPVAAEQIPNLL